MTFFWKSRAIERKVLLFSFISRLNLIMIKTIIFMDMVYLTLNIDFLPHYVICFETFYTLISA